MKITGAATILPVSDIAAAVRFYTDVLGFSEEFRLANYAGVERDSCLIHLSLQSNPNTSAAGTGTIYIFCDGVDDFYREMVGRGARVDGEPKDPSYGMRDFVVKDLDGNLLSLGAPVKNQKSAPGGRRLDGARRSPLRDQGSATRPSITAVFWKAMAQWKSGLKRNGSGWPSRSAVGR